MRKQNQSESVSFYKGNGISWLVHWGPTLKPCGCINCIKWWFAKDNVTPSLLGKILSVRKDIEKGSFSTTEKFLYDDK